MLFRCLLAKKRILHWTCIDWDGEMMSVWRCWHSANKSPETIDRRREKATNLFISLHTIPFFAFQLLLLLFYVFSLSILLSLRCAALISDDFVRADLIVAQRTLHPYYFRELENKWLEMGYFSYTIIIIVVHVLLRFSLHWNSKYWQSDYF